MPKVRTTAKFIRELPEPKVQVGYCDAYYLLKARAPFAYTCGVYGWNFDAYDLDGLILTTGYRNMIGTNVGDVLRRYEEKAEKVCLNYPKYITYDEMRYSLDDLIDEFKAEVFELIG